MTAWAGCSEREDCNKVCVVWEWIDCCILLFKTPLCCMYSMCNVCQWSDAASCLQWFTVQIQTFVADCLVLQPWNFCIEWWFCILILLQFRFIVVWFHLHCFDVKYDTLSCCAVVVLCCNWAVDPCAVYCRYWLHIDVIWMGTSMGACRLWCCVVCNK